MSYVDASLLSVPAPTKRPFTHTTPIESAAPTRRWVRRRRHPAGSRNVRRYTAVGLSLGTSGACPSNGMRMLR